MTDTILLVEDDQDLRESLAELLSLRGYATVAVTNGREALEWLRVNASPCLILLDLMLPVMSGWEFRRQQLADAKFSGIPVVIISGIHDAAIHSQRLNAIAFLPKPINLQSLYDTLDEYC